MPGHFRLSNIHIHPHTLTYRMHPPCARGAVRGAMRRCGWRKADSRSAVFCVHLRSGSCVQLRSAFSCVLRSAAFRILRSAAFCVRLRSAFSCVQRTCVLLCSALNFALCWAVFYYTPRPPPRPKACSSQTFRPGGGKNDLFIAYSLVDPTLVGHEHPLKWPKNPKVPG